MVFRPCGEFGGAGGGSGYVDCYSQNGGHHFYESIKNELESFRLQTVDGDVNEQLLNDDTSSIASKKRIDSMFRTTPSVADENKKSISGDDVADHHGIKSSTANNEHYRGGSGDNEYFDYGYAAADTKNTVQEKIDKMFAEISSSELDTDVSMDSTVAGSNKYHVQYIGCADLSGKISSLEGLQLPVRNMYFSYRENQHRDTDRGEGRDFSGLLEISSVGLTIRYRDERGDTVHRTNPFPTIAVWAALKYVCRRRTQSPQQRMMLTTGSISNAYEYAFLPLIADPDGSNKAPLFRDMDAGDRARLDAAGDHMPVFTVVTRKAGKQLECHGFACETENDALLMAANLYGALVKAMSSMEAADVADTAGDKSAEQRTQRTLAPRRVIRQRNGFTSMSSTAGSSVGIGEVAPALPPPRPPRRNKKSVSSTTSSVGGGSGNGTSAILADEGNVCSDAKTFRMTVRQPPSLRRGVCNSSSSTSMAAMNVSSLIRSSDCGSGDILTKVAIPRSRSFLSSNGLASTKYSRRATGCGIETAADRLRRRSNSSSVMGFSDMFNELRMQEGLNNMNDILNAIINVEGMSYNDLKPIYREFLMKLAMTLTKDELYQRTKVIMTEQKRKRTKKHSSSVTGRGRRLNDKLRDALSLRAAKARIGAVLLPGFCKRKKQNPTFRKQRRCSCSGSENQLKHLNRKNQRRSAATGKRVVTSAALKSRRYTPSSPVNGSTSDDSDFFAAAALRQRQRQLQQQYQQLYKKSKMRASKHGNSKNSSKSRNSDGCGHGTGTASEGGCLHRTSSGYFSCSECSVGVADDKCYCGGDVSTEPMSMVSCSCDSDSCADSDKCYCGRSRRPRNIFDELKSRGFAASESSVSRADSPGTAWKKNELLMSQRHDGPSGSSLAATAAAGGCGGGGGGGIEPSKSIEYLQMTPRRSSVVDQHYSNVVKPDRMKVYDDMISPVNSSTVPGSSSSTSSSLSAATVYSSSSAFGGAAASHHLKQRRSGSSGSDNFRAIDYALFASNCGIRKSRGIGGNRQNQYRAGFGCSPLSADQRYSATTALSANRKSYSSEAVHMAGYRVYHHHHQQQQQQQHQIKTTATRRHSVHDGGEDVLSSFFKSGIKTSLGYYP